MKPALNIANLYPEHFARIVSGEKRTEWRLRKRTDARLEAIETGEPVLLLECGTDRAIRATVRAVMAFSRPDETEVLYGIRLHQPVLVTDSRRRIQGWRRLTESS